MDGSAGNGDDPDPREPGPGPGPNDQVDPGDIQLTYAGLYALVTGFGLALLATLTGLDQWWALFGAAILVAVGDSAGNAWLNYVGQKPHWFLFGAALGLVVGASLVALGVNVEVPVGVFDGGV